MTTTFLSGFLALLVCFKSVMMDKGVPYEFKYEGNLDRLLVRTRIPSTLADMERKVVYLNKLANRVRSVGESFLAGDEAGKLIERAVLEVQRDKRDIEDAITAMNGVKTDSVVISANNAESAKSAITNTIQPKDILKKYETVDNPMEEREVKEVRNWLLTQPKAAWWYKPEMRTPMQMYKNAISKVYVWPREFNFPTLLNKHGNNVATSRQQLMDLLRSGLDTISTRGTQDLKKEWEMRLDLVDKFTADTCDAAEISERLQAFERIVLTLLTNPDLTVNTNVMKKWLLMNQLMYAVDGVSDRDSLVRAWDSDQLGGGFPVGTFELPTPRPQSAPVQDEIDVDTEQTTQKTEKSGSVLTKLRSKVFISKKSTESKSVDKKSTMGTESKMTEAKGTEGTESQNSSEATTAITTNTAATNEPTASAPTKKKGWLW